MSVRAGYKGEITRHPERPGLATADNALENEYQRIEVQPNGSLALTDKRSGEVYSRLLTFEDCADIGEGWFHGMAVNDQVFSSSACAATIAITHNGPYLGSLRVRLEFPLPKEFDFSRMERSREFTRLTTR